IGGVPVVLVAIQDDGCVVADAPTAHELLEALLIDKVTGNWILHIDMPVELDGARQVTYLVEQHIFIGLDQPDGGSIEVLSNPTCLNQYFWMNITGRSARARGRCFCPRHT